MKKYLSKPVVSILTVATLIGGIAPIYASTSFGSKVVMDEALDEKAGIMELSYETKEDKTFIKGKVTDKVVKVELLAPDGRKIEVLQFPNQEFIVGMAAVDSATPQYVLVYAYEEGKTEPIDMKKLLVNQGTVIIDEYIKLALGTFEKEKAEIKIKGVADSSIDSLVVTYAGEKKEVSIDSLFNNKGAFEVKYKTNEQTDASAKAVIEAYKDGEKVETKEIEIKNVPTTKPTPVTFTIKGTATISPKYKQVTVNGTLTASQAKAAENKDLKLYAVAPDGKRHELKLSKNATFEGKVPYKNRSFQAKAVRIELYSKKTLIAQTNLAVSVNNIIVQPTKPVVVPAVIKYEYKDNKDNKGKGKGHEKGKGKGHEKHDDDDNHDDHDDYDDHDDDDDNERDDD